MKTSDICLNLIVVFAYTLRVEVYGVSRYEQITEVLANIQDQVRERLKDIKIDVVNMDFKNDEQKKSISAQGVKLGGLEKFKVSLEQNDDKVMVEITVTYTFTEPVLYFKELKVASSPFKSLNYKVYQDKSHPIQPLLVDLIVTYTHDDTRKKPVQDCSVRLAVGLVSPKQEVQQPFLFSSYFTLTKTVPLWFKVKAVMRRIMKPEDKLSILIYLMLDQKYRKPIQSAMAEALHEVFQTAVNEEKTCVFN